MINNVVEVLFTEHGRFGSPMIEKGLRYLGRQRLRFDKNGDSRMFVNT